MRKKIAILHPQCSRNGGAIKMALMTANVLQEQGHEVCLYVFDRADTCYPDLQSKIEIIVTRDFRSFFLPSFFRKILTLVSLAWDVRHVDIVIANNPPMQIVAAMVRVFSCFRVSTIWWHHHTPWYFCPGKNGSTTKYFILRLKSFLERHCIIPFIGTFVATSHFVADQLLAYSGRKSEVIHPILDQIVDVAPTYQKNVSDELTIFTHSRLEPGKGLDMFMRLSKRLRATFPEEKFRTVIYGSGSLEPSLLKEGMEVVPFSPESTLYGLSKGHSIAVYCSSIDAFGMGPLESQLYGISTVILDRGGASETLVSDDDHTIVGRLVDQEEEVFSLLCYYIVHKMFPENLSIVNFSHPRTYFTINRLSQDLSFLISK